MRLYAEVVDRKQLTPREAEVFGLLCSGLSDKAIARQLGIHIKTVGHHIEHIYEKLGIRWQSINARCTAIGMAVASGMVRLALRSVVLVLMVQALQFDGNVLRPRVPRVSRVVRLARNEG